MNITPIDMWNMAQKMLPKINIPAFGENNANSRVDEPTSQDSQGFIDFLSDSQVILPQNSQL